MNVFGQRERSWRKAQKRGVSPIIATILLVAITVVLAAVLYVLISGLTHGPGSTPIGSAFTAGNPIYASCTGVQTPVGCTTAADHIYTLTVESSTISMTSVLFEVKTSSGSVFTATAGGAFTVVAVDGLAAATYVAGAGGLAMVSAYVTFGASPICAGAACGASTPLTSTYTIVVDVGTAATTGTGLTFVGLGTGSYSGTTASLALP